MTSLKLISRADKTFESIGCLNYEDESYDESTLFRKGTIVQIKDGKFPLTDHKDLYEHSGLFYTINDKKVKLMGFDISCVENKLGKYGDPIIEVSEAQ